MKKIIQSYREERDATRLVYSRYIDVRGYHTLGEIDAPMSSTDASPFGIRSNVLTRTYVKVDNIILDTAC
jgi:hypothetical protein